MRVNRKGAAGEGFFAVPMAIIGGILGIVVLGLAFLLVMNVIRTGSIITAGSLEANATTNLVGNSTAGISTFAAYIPIVFTIGAVVLILAVISFLLLYVYQSRMTHGGI